MAPYPTPCKFLFLFNFVILMNELGSYEEGLLACEKIRIFATFHFELLNFESGKTLDFYSYGALSYPPVNFCSYRILLFF